jgi:hypothetical protein
MSQKRGFGLSLVSVLLSLVCATVVSGCEGIKEEPPAKEYGRLEPADEDQYLDACADADIEMYVMASDQGNLLIAFADFFSERDIEAFVGHEVEITGTEKEVAAGCTLYEVDSIGRTDL